MTIQLLPARQDQLSIEVTSSAAYLDRNSNISRTPYISFTKLKLVFKKKPMARYNRKPKAQLRDMQIWH